LSLIRESDAKYGSSRTGASHLTRSLRYFSILILPVWTCVVRTAFFLQFESFVCRDPELFLNADETQISAHKRHKVFCTAAELPLTEKESAIPHFPAMVTVSGGGYD
jgi:hypothetical protein